MQRENDVIGYGVFETDKGLEVCCWTKADNDANQIE